MDTRNAGFDLRRTATRPGRPAWWPTRTRRRLRRSLPRCRATPIHGLETRATREHASPAWARTAGRARAPTGASIARRQVADPLVVLLVVATVVSAAMGDTLEAVAIGAIVVLNGVLGFVQDKAAERAVNSGCERGSPAGRGSIREGRESELPAEALVPGDLIVLREGDAVPADAASFDASGVEVDESALTGESLPV